jgi:hypothetical protein
MSVAHGLADAQAFRSRWVLSPSQNGWGASRLGRDDQRKAPPGRTERLLADSQIHPISGVRVEVILSAILALIVAVLGALLALAG